MFKEGEKESALAVQCYFPTKIWLTSLFTSYQEVKEKKKHLEFPDPNTLSQQCIDCFPCNYSPKQYNITAYTQNLQRVRHFVHCGEDLKYISELCGLYANIKAFYVRAFKHQPTQIPSGSWNQSSHTPKDYCSTKALKSFIHQE